MNTIQVTKRGGHTENIDLDKIHKVLEWAAEGLDVSVSQVEMNAQIQFTTGIKTSDIHETLVKSSADLISAESPDYQYFAARLEIFALRKEAYGRFTPPSLMNHLRTMTDTGFYDSHIIKDYSLEEIGILDDAIKHERDLDFAYAAVQQFKGKYLVQDRTSKKVSESPQMLYMVLAMALHADKPTDRLGTVIALYTALSTFKISFPTPVMAGVRTPTRQFSSCVLIEAGDSLDSIAEASTSIIKYISQRAGIGLNVGAIRAEGSPIRNGEAVHTGLIPFLKLFQAAVKSCSQGSIRGGAATVFYPGWHLEFESLIVLKNNKGIEENRVRNMDYTVQLNKLMYERLLTNSNITLFSPSDVPGLLDAFYADQELFEELYTAAEADPTIRKKTLKAYDFFTQIMNERAATGRIYIQHIDHCNTHSPFDPKLAPVKQSNLCLEVALPTEPVMPNGTGEVALCTLSAFNLGTITPAEIPRLAMIQVEALDALLDYQDYPLVQAYTSTMKYRPLGIGVINYANWIAKNGYKYSDGSANAPTHELFELIQYSLLKASNDIARYKGSCTGFADTTYSQGLLPIDTYKKEVDEVHTAELKQDWEKLRADIAQYGLRNATLSALMPSETSSQISNSTSGIEPPRALLSIKVSKDGVLRQLVPDLDRVTYELYWDIIKACGNKGYIELCAIMQKFVDQSISANTAYDPNNYEDKRVPMQLMLQDIMTAYRLGLKTLYYANTRDDDVSGISSFLEEASEDCDGGGCKI